MEQEEEEEKRVIVGSVRDEGTGEDKGAENEEVAAAQDAEATVPMATVECDDECSEEEEKYAVAGGK